MVGRKIDLRRVAYVEDAAEANSDVIELIRAA